MQGRALLTAATMVSAAAILASCASPPPPKSARSKEYFSEKKYGVKASPRVVSYGERVPQGGGRRMVGKPYTVAGRVYKPQDVDEDYTAVGRASWYGSAFHGRLTANGEVYDVDSITAAHPTMPLPSYARVTNVENGRSVVVRVNDRGPYHSNRMMDLSERAAELLDTKRDGVGTIQVQYLGPAPLEGHDQKKLLATYQGPGSNASGGMGHTMLAFLGLGGRRDRDRDVARPAAVPQRAEPAPVLVAMAPIPRDRPEYGMADGYAVDAYTYAVIAAREEQAQTVAAVEERPVARVTTRTASVAPGLAPGPRSLGTINVSQPIGYGEETVVPAVWSDDPVYAVSTAGSSFSAAPMTAAAHAAAADLARQIDLASALEDAAGREAERRGLR